MAGTVLLGLCLRGWNTICKIFGRISDKCNPVEVIWQKGSKKKFSVIIRGDKIFEKLKWSIGLLVFLGVVHRFKNFFFPLRLKRDQVTGD